MDRLDNEDIGIIWARHYPKRCREWVVEVALFVTRDGNSAAGQIHDSSQRLVR